MWPNNHWILILCCLTLSPCSPNRVIKSRMCDAPSMGHCTPKIPFPLFESSSVVIPMVGFSLSSHRCSHLPPGGLGWETLMDLPGKIAPTAKSSTLRQSGKNSQDLARRQTNTTKLLNEPGNVQKSPTSSHFPPQSLTVEQ